MKNIQNSNSVLYAFYDLQICTVTFDFLSFLLRAEMHRIQSNFKSLHIVFVPGDDDGFRMMHLTGDVSRWRLQNMHIAACSFLSSIEGITVCPTRAQATSIEDNLASNIFPVDYTTHIFDSQKAIQASIDAFMFAGVVIRHLKGDEVPVLTPTLRAQQYVREWYEKHANGRKVIAITLRESPNDPARNSNLDAWARFAATIDENEFLPVIIRDTDAVFLPVPEELKGLCHFNEAAIDLDLRLAFYESAFLNMLVNNGPLQICYLNPKIRYLAYKMFNATNEADERATCGVYGIPIGGQLPMATPFQRIIWNDDCYETLVDSFANASCAVNYAIERGDLDKIENRPIFGRDESYRFAVTLHQVGRCTHALDIYDHLLSLDQDDFDAAVMRGLALLHLARPTEAKKALKFCLDRQPHSPQCIFNLALAEKSLGNATVALDLLENLRKSDCKLNGISGLLAKLYLSQGHISKAADEFAIEVERDRSNWRAKLDLASCHERLGKNKTAARMYNSFVVSHKKQKQKLDEAKETLFPRRRTILKGRHKHLVLPLVGSTQTMEIWENEFGKPKELNQPVVFVEYDLEKNDDLECEDPLENFVKFASGVPEQPNHICIVPKNIKSMSVGGHIPLQLVMKWIPLVRKNRGFSFFICRNRALEFLAIQNNTNSQSLVNDESYQQPAMLPPFERKQKFPMKATIQAAAYINVWRSSQGENLALTVILLGSESSQRLIKDDAYGDKFLRLIRDNRQAGSKTALVIPFDSCAIFSTTEAYKFGIHLPASLHFDLQLALVEAANTVYCLDCVPIQYHECIREVHDVESLLGKTGHENNISVNHLPGANKTELKIDAAFKLGVRLFCGGITTFNKGVQVFQQILRVTPDHANTIGMLGVAANIFRKHSDAIDLFENAIALKRDEPAFLFNLGIALYEEGNLQEAIKAFETSATQDPILYEPWDYMGDAYRKMGKLEKAICSYGKGISLGGKSFDTFVRLANCHEILGNVSLALENYRAAGEVVRKFDDKEQACTTMIWPWRPKLIRPEDGEFIGGYLDPQIPSVPESPLS
ncbi:MAG: tetratricopeptide repeat protein [Pseudomonadota bacterium]|nr:tetratricopeptide repeat protein [Pseudomonadota bacterium]